MFRPTLPRRLAMVSTHGGMRRILKQRSGGASDGVLTYIRQAVESGTYRTTQEIDDMLRARAAVSGLSGVELNSPEHEQDDGSGLDDLKTVMRRYRQDIVRGSAVVDYPSEYLILRQFPPLPDPPRTPAKVQRRLQRQRQEQERAAMKPLVQKYINRQQQQQKSQRGSSTKAKGGSTTSSSEDYYRQLLGVPAPPVTTMLGQKTAAVQKAYAAAMVHYQLVRSSSDEEQMSDAEISRKVDELLQQAHEEEVETSQTVTEQVQKWRAAQEQEQQEQKQQEIKTEQSSSATSASSSSSSSSATAASAAAVSAASSILGNDARKVHGMLRWSKRLQAVPYRQWTVGASTALDHWIARQVLQLQEDSWQSLLEGSVDNSEDDLIELGRQIVTVRQALFPETMLESSLSSWQEEDEDEYEDTTDASEAGSPEKSSSRDSVEKNIEELLASLGSMSSPSSTETNTTATTKMSLDATETDDGNDNKALDDWTHQLQNWRSENTSSFQEWPQEQKDEFRAFVREYASITASYNPSNASTTAHTTATMSMMDKRDHEDDTLLQTLLEHPPVNKTESNAFWNALQTKHEAAKLLETLRAANDSDNDSPDASIAAAMSLLEFFITPSQIFFRDDQSEQQQMDRLLNLGALRPLLDEYVSEEERIDFWKRHGDVIFANVPLEYLIAVDPGSSDDGSGSSGIITGHDLQGTPLSRDLELVLSPQSRFLLQTLPFRQDASSLLHAWNQHKSSRARYEEELFQTGRLGLRYPEDARKEEKDEDDSNTNRKRPQRW